MAAANFDDDGFLKENLSFWLQQGELPKYYLPIPVKLLLQFIRKFTDKNLEKTGWGVSSWTKIFIKIAFSLSMKLQ